MRRRPSIALSVLAGVGLALSAPLVSASAVADEGEGASPAPENLRVVLNDSGFVDRLEWDAPSGDVEPVRYDVNYRFASDGPLGEQVFWWTGDTYLEASTSFGRFVECTPHHHPSDTWVVWITYDTPDGTSARSNQARMCLP